MEMVQNNVIVMVDIVGSSRAKVEAGDGPVNDRISERLLQVERRFAEADPSLIRPQPAAGDGILLTGTDATALFVEAMRIQQDWQSFEWKTALPVRIAIGAGRYEVMDDPVHGDRGWKVLRGGAVDFTARLLDLPPTVVPPGKVAVAESARALIQADGLGFKLIRHECDIPGFGREIIYVSNGHHHSADNHYCTPREVAIFWLGVFAAGIAASVIQVLR